MVDEPDEPGDPGEAPEQPSVLDFIERKTGAASRVSLDDDAEPSAPVIDPGSDEKRALPHGRSHYQILGEIARGGMGVVLRGHDTDLGRDVALKVLHKDVGDDPAILQRFIEEAQIGGQLQHPGIVPVYELGLMADERPYFTMKLVKGKTLAALLGSRSTPAEDRTRFLDVFEAVCQTVAYAHSRGVIHRDLKPANVMVGAFGEVQVVDWGLAKVLPRGTQADEERARRPRDNTVLDTVRSRPQTDSSHSMAGSVMGTPAYMSPEQAGGRVEKLDERSDVFCLGAILCEILTGSPPYTGEPADVLENAAAARLDDAFDRLAGSEAAPELIELARQCLTPAQGARPRDAERVAKRVREHVESREERARRAEVEVAVQRKAKWLWSGVVASVLVVAGGGVAYKEHVESRALAQQLAIESDVFAARLEAAALREEARQAASDEVWGRAYVAAQRAAALAASGRVEQRGEIEALVVEIEEERDALRLASANAERRELFLTALERQLQSNALLFPGGLAGETDRRYAATFELLGIDPRAGTPESVTAKLTAAGFGPGSVDAPTVGAALDDWGASSFSVPRGEHLLDVARRIDPDPFRNRLRGLLLTNDRSAVMEIASSPAAYEASPTSVLMLVHALGRNELVGPIDEIVEAARANHPGDLRMNGIRSMIALYDGGNVTDALAYATAMEALDPADLTSAVWRACLFAALDRADEAREVLDRVLAQATGAELRPAVSIVCNGLRIGRVAGGMRAVRELLEQRVDRPGVAGALGSLLVEEGDFEAAAPLLRKRLQEVADHSWMNGGLWSDLAYALTMTGSHAEAIDVLERMVAEAGDEVPDVAQKLSWYLSNAPDPALHAPDRALELAERACELAPDIESNMEALAAALYRSARYDEELGVLALMTELNDGLRKPAAYYRALCLQRLGLTDEARIALDRARAIEFQAGNPNGDILWRRRSEWLQEEAIDLIEGR